MVRAAEQGEEMLRLCEGDNLGVRFRLMHIYAFLEQKDKALNLYKKFDEYKETQMLLPLSVLYFKMGDIEKAKEYLELLNDTNKDTKEFFTAINNNELDEHMAEVGDYGYRPFTIEEFIIELTDNNFLFTSAPLFLEWAYEQTRNM